MSRLLEISPKKNSEVRPARNLRGIHWKAHGGRIGQHPHFPQVIEESTAESQCQGEDGNEADLQPHLRKPFPTDHPKANQQSKDGLQSQGHQLWNHPRPGQGAVKAAGNELRRSRQALRNQGQREYREHRTGMRTMNSGDQPAGQESEDCE